MAEIKNGFGRRNVHCSNCGDERGGPFGHEISECQWYPGMSVHSLTRMPHMAGRESEVWDTYIGRYFEAQEPGEERRADDAHMRAMEERMEHEAEQGEGGTR